ncbi:cyclopropane-fatty-acyl-phospholipid synthase [Amphritea atlantica]|uniref:Cyclopropane-fatty-acyl-phospholipid synthase n=1 Tax=Amphritea atlantica TaxID=355243 RepID=A0A1H9GM22_9GAMM|nr:cyclopropane-fatty-acyl-phospholipid synthase family protein [Amphritea atlantica]SEQ51172.1 cyclopropane-fatty-acyl-phospholipid synthase [Amphritea atlantica]
MKTCNYQTSSTAGRSQVKTLAQPSMAHHRYKQEYNTAIKPDWLEQRVLNRLGAPLSQTRGRIHLIMPSGYQQAFGQGSLDHDQPDTETCPNQSDEILQVTVQLNSLRCLLRLYTGGITGWSEGYIAGEWDSPDLTALVRWALQNEKTLEGFAKAGFIKQLLDNIHHWRNHNSRTGSRRNIAAHYDLGNDFYRLWLDPTMSYSSALFSSPLQSLEQAQTAKYQRILDLLKPEENDHILEIGCGWGGFAERALRQHKVRVHGVTLSEEQLQWSRNRLRSAGLDKSANISLTDYRDLLSQYDAVVSIEMFEAVGEKYWDSYFNTLEQSLKPGGKAVLQVISIEEERFKTYRNQADFIQRYIFPGGMLPSISRLEQKFAEHGFTLEYKQLFGKDYARTLRLWRESFEQHSEALEQLGYDERFRRLWRYYLCYCEGGFEEGTIDVGLYQLINRNTD